MDPSLSYFLTVDLDRYPRSPHSQVLLDRGADPSLTDTEGRTALAHCLSLDSIASLDCACMLVQKVSMPGIILQGIVKAVNAELRVQRCQEVPGAMPCRVPSRSLARQCRFVSVFDTAP